MSDVITAAVQSGAISADLAAAMRETKRICTDRCPVCNVGRGRWCDHRIPTAYGTKRSILGEIGR